MSAFNKTETLPLSTSTAPRPPLRMSYEEYRNSDHEGGLTEWVDGEVIFHALPNDGHQTIVEFLDRLLGFFVELFKLGLVRVAPFSMRVLEGGAAREPDVFFLATEHLGRLTRTELNGPADLAVEVISDESVGRDRGDKFYEYQEGGVREYWIIDPRPKHRRVDFYVLDAKGSYQPVPIGEDGIYRSTVLPDFWLKIEWLWADKPDAPAALAEIVGFERMMAAFRGQA